MHARGLLTRHSCTCTALAVFTFANGGQGPLFAVSGGTLTITVVAFLTPQGTVTVAGSPWPVISWIDSKILCTVQQGTGNNEVVVLCNNVGSCWNSTQNIGTCGAACNDPGTSCFYVQRKCPTISPQFYATDTPGGL